MLVNTELQFCRGKSGEDMLKIVTCNTFILSRNIDYSCEAHHHCQYTGIQILSRYYNAAQFSVEPWEGKKKKKKNRIDCTCKMYVCTMPYLSICTPVPYLPLLFPGVSASDLPTKSISLIPQPKTQEQISSTAEPIQTLHVKLLSQ